MDRLGKWVTVLMFFYVVYHSIAETLPTTFEMPRAGGEAPFLGADDGDYTYRVVNKFIQGLDKYMHDPDIRNIGPGTFAGTKRHLQYTSRNELFLEYTAWANAANEDAAGYHQFLRVANRLIGPGSKIIGIRKSSEHAQCNVCYELKSKIKQARTQAAKAEAYRKYSHHILSQWLDRQVYWAFRSQSQQYFRQMLDLGGKLLQGSLTTNLLSCIMDGLDQAKLRTPRVLHRHSKLYDALFRPACHMVGCWIHGFKLHFYISDADQRKDSNAQLEVLSRSLSDLFDEFHQLPAGLQVQQDNCFREGKNQYVLAYLLLLVILAVLRHTLASYLRTGHSHEDIDQVFGAESGFLAKREWSTALELVQLLDSTCRSENQAEKRNDKRKAAASKLDECALWKDWAKRLNIALKGIRIFA